MRRSTSPSGRGRRAATAARREGDAEAGGQDRDGDVVQARLPAVDLVREAALEIGGHADEHVAPRLGHR